MLYGTRFIYETQYEYAGTNQHGDRYKRVGEDKVVKACRMTDERDNAKELFDLIVLSDRLQVPIHWDSTTSPQTAWIEVRAL